MNPLHQHEDEIFNREFRNIYRLLDDLQRFKADITDSVNIVRSQAAGAGNGFGLAYGTYIGDDDANQTITVTTLSTLRGVFVWRDAPTIATAMGFRGQGYSSTECLRVDGAPDITATTGIRAMSGNTFTVQAGSSGGAWLNSEGVTYHYIALGVLA